MGNWAGDVMVISAKEILSILDHMKELNTKLIGDVGAYGRVMQDNIKNSAESLTMRINVVVDEAKKVVAEKADKLNEAGSKLISLESSISSKIDDLK